MKKTADRRGLVLPGLLVSLALCFMLFIYAPYELYLTNPGEFWFSVKQMLPYTLALFAAGTALCAAALFLAARFFPPRICSLLTAVLLFALIAFYLQGNFLVAGLPGLDGTEFDRNAYPAQRLLSGLCWGGSAVIVFLLFIKTKGRLFSRLAVFLGGGSALLMLLTLAGLFIVNGKSEDKVLAYTNAHLLDFSKEENFIILHLDAVDPYVFESVLSEAPEYRKAYEDFTYFDNTMSGYPYTKCSIPLILTGKWYEAKGDFNAWVNDAIADSPIFSQLSVQNYQLGLYDLDNFLLSEKKLGGMFENTCRKDLVITSKVEMAKTILRMAIIKYFPWDLKEVGYRVQNTMYGFRAVRSANGEDCYFWDNILFYERLNEPGAIRVRPEKTFKYIELKGGHTPFSTGKDVSYDPNATYFTCVEASMKIVARTIELMKENNVYENAVIVVLSDHGFLSEGNEPYHRQHSVLMIKGRGERHDFSVNHAPLSHADLCEGFVRLLDGATGDSCFDWQPGQSRERRFLGYDCYHLDRFEEYIQTGLAQEADTMTLTGRIFTP